MRQAFPVAASQCERTQRSISRGASRGRECERDGGCSKMPYGGGLSSAVINTKDRACHGMTRVAERVERQVPHFALGFETRSVFFLLFFAVLENK